MGQTLINFIVFLVKRGSVPEANAMRLILTCVGNDIFLPEVKIGVLREVIHFLSMRYKSFDRMVGIVEAAQSAMELAKMQGFVEVNPFDEIESPTAFVKENSNGKK